jgi:hypothetical protein
MAFVLVRLDRLDQARDQLMVDKIPVALTRPKWLD